MGRPPSVVCIWHTDMPGMHRLRARARAGDLELFERPDLSKPAVLARVLRPEPRFALSWFWPKKLPPALVDAVPTYGVHPSLLPRWRGPDPYFWALRAGDAETGVTLHRVAHEYDTGGIVRREQLPIWPTDNSWTLAKRLDRPAARLLAYAARELCQGRELLEQSQDQAAVTEAPVPSEEETALNFSREDADTLLCIIRASCPSPLATAEICGHTIGVLRARLATAPTALEPGEACRDSAGVIVRALRGALLLEEIEDEAGTIRRGTSIHALLGEGARASNE